MLVACRLAGLSALETYYARTRVGRAMQGGVAARTLDRPLGASGDPFCALPLPQTYPGASCPARGVAARFLSR
jgi:hypothetical protein